MYVWSKALVVGLAVTLSGYGAMGLQAKNHKNHNNQCAQPEGCPAPQIQTPTIESNCCPVPPVESHCGPPAVQTDCCGVVDNSRDIDRAHRAAMRAYHEAKEACHKRQEAIARAQQRVADRVASEQRRIDRANDHFNHELSELQERNATYAAFYGGPSESGVETAVATPEPTPQPEPEVRAKPEPAPIVQPEPTPEPIAQPTPQPPVIEKQVEVAVVTPPAPMPAPSPAPEEPKQTSKQLPKTASPLGLIGLMGLGSTMAGFLTRFFRG
jgi:hypothetical protein